MSSQTQCIKSKKGIKKLKSTRKRKAGNKDEWKDKAAKIKKDAGKEYVSRDGILRPSKDPPSGRKVCLKCNKPGCDISPERKLDLFIQFRSVPGDIQSTLLFGCIERVQPARRTGISNRRDSSYRYYLMDEEGFRQEACLKTIIDVFGVSEDRIRVLKEKMRDGVFAPTDGRGRHSNRPHSKKVEDHGSSLTFHPQGISTKYWSSSPSEVTVSVFSEI